MKSLRIKTQQTLHFYCMVAAKDETEAKSLLNARNEAQRQPVLNLHLARAYLTASDPALVERLLLVLAKKYS